MLAVVYGSGLKATFRAWDLGRRAVAAEAPSCDRAGTADFDGRGRAAVGSRDGGVLVLDLAGGGVTRLSLPDPPGRVRWSGDGRFLAAGAGQRVVRILDPAQGIVRKIEFAEEVFDLSWHPFVPRVAVAAGPDVRIVDARNGRLVRVLQGHHQTVSDVSYETCGSRLASGGWDRRTVLWDAETGEQLLVLPRFARLTGRFLKGTAGTEEAWLDEIVPSPCLRAIEEHEMWAGPRAAAFSPDRRLFATAPCSSSSRARDRW
jgi:WD40 repeat protein